MVNCNVESTKVDATSVWKADGEGLLPGEWYGYLAFYGFLALGYLFAAFGWWVSGWWETPYRGGVKREHVAALPCSTLLYPALPCSTLLYPALPCSALPRPALPCPALPCPALPCRALL